MYESPKLRFANRRPKAVAVFLFWWLMGAVHQLHSKWKQTAEPLRCETSKERNRELEQQVWGPQAPDWIKLLQVQPSPRVQPCVNEKVEVAGDQ